MKSGLAEHGIDARPLQETETALSCAAGRPMRREGVRLSQPLELRGFEVRW